MTLRYLSHFHQAVRSGKKCIRRSWNILNKLKEGSDIEWIGWQDVKVRHVGKALGMRWDMSGTRGQDITVLWYTRFSQSCRHNLARGTCPRYTMLISDSRSSLWTMKISVGLKLGPWENNNEKSKSSFFDADFSQPLQIKIFVSQSLNILQAEFVRVLRRFSLKIDPRIHAPCIRSGDGHQLWPQGWVQVDCLEFFCTLWIWVSLGVVRVSSDEKPRTGLCDQDGDPIGRSRPSLTWVTKAGWAVVSHAWVSEA